VLPQVSSGLNQLFDAEAWRAWLAELDRGFLFLLLLPFVIGAIGLWAAYLRDRGDGDGERGK